MTNFSIFNLRRASPTSGVSSCSSPPWSLCSGYNTHKCSVPQTLISELLCMPFHLPSIISTPVLLQGSSQATHPPTITVSPPRNLTNTCCTLFTCFSPVTPCDLVLQGGEGYLPLTPSYRGPAYRRHPITFVTTCIKSTTRLGKVTLGVVPCSSFSLKLTKLLP